MFDALKQPPPRPSLSYLDELVAHLRWLEIFGDKSLVLAGLTPAKVRHFAAEAQVLDAAKLKVISAPKRYTLLLCLIQRAQIQARDDLARTACSRHLPLAVMSTPSRRVSRVADLVDTLPAAARLRWTSGEQSKGIRESAVPCGRRHA